jgi:plastocyanin
MKRTTWILAAALFSLGACSATSPSGGLGGGPAGQITVGNIFYQSAHNGTQNPAVDTIAVGGSVTWKWNAAGSHSIRSTGLPPAVFRNSVVLSAANSTYSVTFMNPGTYDYDCGVHGPAMSGRIVVQ